MSIRLKQNIIIHLLKNNNYEEDYLYDAQHRGGTYFLHIVQQ